MFRRTAAVGFGLILAFAPIAASAAAASSTPSSPAEIVLLQTLITSLETALKAIVASRAAAPTPGVATTTAPFARVLSLGSKGAGVSALQRILKTAGYYTYPTITGYFGPLTKKALAAYQTAHGLNPLGYTGPKTRALLNNLASPLGSGSETQSAAISPSTSSPATEATITAPSSGESTPLFPIAAGYGGGGTVTTPPTISGTPSDSTATATSAAGATVTYATPTATDYFGESDAVACRPASGSTFALGVITVSCTTTDKFGNSAHSSFTVTVKDTSAPSVSMSAPSNGATVGGSSVTLTATATDSLVAVANVQFEVDGTDIGSAVTSSPYTTTWNSKAVSDDSHTLYAVAESASGTYATSSVSVSVRNSPPIITSIATSSLAASTVTITWTTDEPATSQVNYGTTTGYGSASSSAALVTSHSITLTGLTASSTYDFQVESVDAESNTATSSNQTLTTSWVLAGAQVDMNFAASQYYGGTLSGLITDARASTAYASDLAGDLISFGPDVPRITNQGFLIEESRTNYETQSGLASGFIAGGTTVTANYATSPDGTTDAAFLREGTTTANFNFTLNSISRSSSSAITYTLSWYAARVGSPRDLEIFIYDGSFGNAIHAFFNLGNGDTEMVGAGGSTAVPISTSCLPASRGFWRCSYTFTSAAVAGMYIQFSMLNAAGSGGVDSDAYTWTGDGASGLYMYGLQLEQGPFATSYIPTAGSTVTRAADVVTLNGAAQTALNASTGSAVAVTTGGYTYATTTTVLDSNGTALLGFTSSNMLTDALGSSLATANTANRLIATDSSGIAWSPSGRTLVLDGGTAVTDSVTQTPSSTLHLGSNGSANFLDGYVSRLTLWNTQLATPQSEFSLVSGVSDLGLFVAGPENYAYVFPTSADWSYIASKGIKFIRLSIAWENIQPTLASPLNSTYLNALKSALASAAADNITVIIDLQNYGFYANSTAWGTTVNTAGNDGQAATNVYALGSSNLPVSDFTDLWSRMATALVGAPGLGGYGLMNEPSNLASTSTWPTAAQDAINAVRAVDPATPIYVAGDGTANSAGFATSRWSPPSVTGTNLVYEAHDYFDAAEGVSGGGTYSGTYSSYNIDNYSGIESLLSWLGWLKANNLKGFLGEFGVPNDTNDNDPQWLVLEQHFMSLLAQQGVPGVMSFYGSGVAGNGAILRVNPVGGVDDTRLTNTLGQF